jgi:hypothetical protein
MSNLFAMQVDPYAKLGRMFRGMTCSPVLRTGQSVSLYLAWAGTPRRRHRLAQRTERRGDSRRRLAAMG